MVTERETPARQWTSTPFWLLRASSVETWNNQLGSFQKKEIKIHQENAIILTAKN